MSGRIQAALIDLDGTLLDTLADFTHSLNAMLADLDLPALHHEQVRTLIGRGSEHLIQGALSLQASTRAANADLYEQAWHSYQTHYQRLNGRYAQIYPGVTEGLTRMRACGWKLACVTNKPQTFAQDLLRIKGLAGFFKAVVGGDSHPRKKPDPMPLLKTCERLQTSPQRTLMVGDSIHDAHAAHAAHCPLVLVNYGYHQGIDLSSQGALAVVTGLDQISFDTLG